MEGAYKEEAGQVALQKFKPGLLITRQSLSTEVKDPKMGSNIEYRKEEKGIANYGYD